MSVYEVLSSISFEKGDCFKEDRPVLSDIGPSRTREFPVGIMITEIFHELLRDLI